MPWYDVLFLLVLALGIGWGVSRLIWPKLSEDEQARWDEKRKQRRREMALTYSPSEKVWLGISMLTWAVLLILFSR